ncbi:hypothetical protein BC940DRAFT_311662 [Gongronella butleri]|nr:hypothetical protein BC940DRAFT_311662 [Gongronella butleri]
MGLPYALFDCFLMIPLPSFSFMIPRSLTSSAAFSICCIYACCLLSLSLSISCPLFLIVNSAFFFFL